MADAFKCDGCKAMFEGKPAMELGARFPDPEYEQKMKVDGKDGEYCSKCADDIQNRIGKRWGPD